MQSISSFLQHLARTTAPGGKHDDQVLALMKHVRDVAYYCNDCIDFYVMRSNPAFHLNSGLRCLSWIPWYLQKLAAQRTMAVRLSEIKARLRDISERSLIYGLVIPAPIHGPTATAPDDDLARLHDSIRPFVFAQQTSSREECKQELLQWLLRTQDMSADEKFVSIAVTAPDEKDREAIGAFDDDSIRAKFHRIFFISFITSSIAPAAAGPGLPAGPLDILEGIMKNLVPNTNDKPVMIQDKIAEIKENIRVKLEAEQLELEPLDILSDAIPEQRLLVLTMKSMCASYGSSFLSTQKRKTRRRMKMTAWTNWAAATIRSPTISPDDRIVLVGTRESRRAAMWTHPRASLSSPLPALSPRRDPPGPRLLRFSLHARCAAIAPKHLRRRFRRAASALHTAPTVEEAASARPPHHAGPSPPFFACAPMREPGRSPAGPESLLRRRPRPCACSSSGPPPSPHACSAMGESSDRRELCCPRRWWQLREHVLPAPVVVLPEQDAAAPQSLMPSSRHRDDGRE